MATPHAKRNAAVAKERGQKVANPAILLNMDTTPMPETAAPWRPESCDRIALVLQGGGALGAYQAGVYEALSEAHIEPDWVSGVSIGAINAALIAGNRPQDRLPALREFWRRITDRTLWLFAPDGDVFRQGRNAFSAFTTALLGQPGFFEPHKVHPWFLPAGAKDATSYYDNSAMRRTLQELVDFDLINARAVRFSVGAVNVLTGNFVFFDNARETITPAHIMASGALPPAFPMVQVGTDYFWDGGIVSNTPLQHILAQDDNLNSLVFQVDLFSATGPLPRTIQEVEGRHKEIMYSSRTRQVTDMFARLMRWKNRCHDILQKVPEELLTPEEREMRDKLSDLPRATILQLIYQKQAYEGAARDYEFSADSMHEHWRNGHEDTRRTLEHKKWLEMPPRNGGIVTHDLHRDYGR
jgi:NTE family protein